MNFYKISYFSTVFKNPKPGIRKLKGRFFLSLVTLLVFASHHSFSQTKSNLDIFYILADSSVKSISGELPPSTKEVFLELNNGVIYSVFNTQIISSFNTGGIAASSQKDLPKIIYVIDNASVKYEDMFRDGFLGRYLVQRTLAIKGNYLIQGSPVKNFSYAYKDTINVDDIKKNENPSFPFTQGEIPPEPFFSGLFEPVVAIGTSALAVILFFTIRSK